MLNLLEDASKDTTDLTQTIALVFTMIAGMVTSIWTLRQERKRDAERRQERQDDRDSLLNTCYADWAAAADVFIRQRSGGYGGHVGLSESQAESLNRLKQAMSRIVIEDMSELSGEAYKVTKDLVKTEQFMTVGRDGTLLHLSVETVLIKRRAAVQRAGKKKGSP